jgi:hypothetical protein
MKGFGVTYKFAVAPRLKEQPFCSNALCRSLAFSTFAAGRRFGRYWGKSRHGRMGSKTTRMTRSVIFLTANNSVAKGLFDIVRTKLAKGITHAGLVRRFSKRFLVRVVVAAKSPEPAARASGPGSRNQCSVARHGGREWGEETR